MPTKPSIFERIRRAIFGSKRKEEPTEYFEVVYCSNCEIRKLFVSELQKRFGEERKKGDKPGKQMEELPRVRYIKDLQQLVNQ